MEEQYYFDGGKEYAYGIKAFQSKPSLIDHQVTLYSSGRGTEKEHYASDGFSTLGFTMTVWAITNVAVTTAIKRLCWRIQSGIITLLSTTRFIMNTPFINNTYSLFQFIAN